MWLYFYLILDKAKKLMYITLIKAMITEGDKMTRREYMQRLYKALAPISKENRNKIIKDYESHFSQELNSGKIEEAIIYNLGSPENAAKHFINIYKSDTGYHDNYTVEQFENENSNTAHSWEAAVWGTLSIVLVPVMAAIMMVLFALGIALMISGIVMIFIGFVINWLSVGFILLGIAGLFLSVFGVLVSVLALYDGINMIGKYFSFIRRRIRYGGKRK